MDLQGIRVGLALTGSHCTIEKILIELKALIKEGAIVFPILSPAVNCTDTRFGSAASFKRALVEITGKEPIVSIVEAEPVGPQNMFDILVIAPCTGNTIAKLANGITDTAVLMSAKAHLRNLKPVVLGIATNDALSINAKNIGLLLNMKNIYFVPFGQDNYENKPNSVVARFEFLRPTIKEALQGRQLQPLIVAVNNLSPSMNALYE